MATTIDGSGIEFSGGGISLPLKYVDITFNLQSVTWYRSSSPATNSKYYAFKSVADIMREYSITITAPIAVSLANWGGIKESDIIQPVVQNTSVAVLSNVNTFSPTTGTQAYVTARLLYV